MYNRLNFERLFLMFSLVLLFLSCKSDDHLNPIKFGQLEAIIQDYADQNEAFPHFVSLDSTEVYPKPSYHVYIYLWEEDTIISIVQEPLLVRSHILAIEYSDSTLFYRDIEPLGFIKYKNEIPVVLFDPDSLVRKSLWAETFIDVPESYEFNGLNIHRESVIWDYDLRSGELQRNDRGTHITEKRS